MAKARQEDELEVLERANAMVERQREAAGQDPSIYEQMWQLLDQRIDRLMGEVANMEVAALKSEAIGIAECIAIIGKPLVKDVDDVRAKAMERYQARQRSVNGQRSKRATRRG